MKRPELFGTDGMRGVFGDYPLDETTVTRLGRALASSLEGADGAPPRVILGGDTRSSTPALCRWLSRGLAAGGAEVVFLGTVPTPGVAFTARRLGAACGVAVSASHNPLPDNGIKVIGGDGFKWPVDDEVALEERLAADTTDPGELPEVALAVDRPALEAYLDSLVEDAGGDGALAGLRVAVDAANGAASPFVETLFARLGAALVAHHASPDGENINVDCGSTHPAVIARATAADGADVGFAFDGDADRCIVADETGRIRDGDAILYLWASDLAARGELPGGRIVATSMSNLGLERALGRREIGVERCGVGDRVVVETMRREGIVLGGEQSGHVVCLDLSTTGDGLLTALQIARIRQQAGTPLSALLRDLQVFPQVIENVRVKRKPDLDGLPRVREKKAEVERRLGARGRLVLRYSGTEPLCRVMIEGEDKDVVESLAAELGATIAEELG